MTKTREELTEDDLYQVVRTSCEFLMDGDIYKILGSNEENIWTVMEGDDEEYIWTYSELLSEIKSSDAPVEFFQLKKFAGIM
jgi:hypothetical protein